MPKCLDRELPEGRLLLWRIDESTEQLTELAGIAPPAHIKSIPRLQEHLAWRALLAQAREGAQVYYDNHGAPHTNGCHISVSHTRGYAALLISDEQCGVDIELANRDFSRTSSRFVCSQEQELCQWPLLEAACWCAKESMYKLFGVQGLDFLTDMRLTSLNAATGELTATIQESRMVVGRVVEIDGLVLCAVKFL